jgi:hypothetical protein
MPLPIHRRIHSCHRPLVLLAAALLSAACAGVPTQTSSMQVAPDLIVSASQLQLRTFEMGRTLSTRIEQAADSIASTSPDSAVQRNALLWKISAIPLVQDAALRNDPLVAIIDLVGLTMQQATYFSTGSGSESFGPWQPIAIAAARRAEADALALLANNFKPGSSLSKEMAELRTWASNHPMQGPALRRASILGSDWEALGFTSTSLAATIGNVDHTLTNLTFRLSYLNESLAQQARWSAELAVSDVMAAPKGDSIYRTFTSALGSVGVFADSMPLLLVLDQERLALMSDIDRQRVLAFQDVAAQVTVLRAALTSEREALMAQVAQERAAIFLSADSLVARSLVDVEAAMARLVVKLLAGALIVVLALLAGGGLLVRRWRAVGA